jgi:hypothetical protein
MLTFMKLIFENLQDPVRLRALLILLLVVLALGIDRTIMEKKPTHTNIVNNTQVSHQKFNEECKTILDSSGASRCLVYEFHNGESNIAGVPWLRFSNTHETTAASISREINQSQKIYAREIIPWISNFMQNQCVVQNVANAEPTMRTSMDIRGVILTYNCPIFFKFKKEPIGYVSVEYTRGWTSRMEDGELELMLRKFAQLVSAELIRIRDDL